MFSSVKFLPALVLLCSGFGGAGADTGGPGCWTPAVQRAALGALVAVGYGERESGPADKPVVGKWFPVPVALAPPIFCGVSGGGTRWALMTLPTQTIPCFSGAQGHRHPVLAEQPGRPLLIALEQCVPCWSFPALQPSSALLAERPQPRRARSASSAAALPPRLLGRSLLMSSHTCWHKHIL